MTIIVITLIIIIILLVFNSSKNEKVKYVDYHSNGKIRCWCVYTDTKADAPKVKH